ncbi:hypothetical protein Tco_1126524 [Tanacetum coccineum]
MILSKSSAINGFDNSLPASCLLWSSHASAIILEINWNYVKQNLPYAWPNMESCSGEVEKLMVDRRVLLIDGGGDVDVGIGGGVGDGIGGGGDVDVGIGGGVGDGWD